MSTVLRVNPRAIAAFFNRSFQQWYEDSPFQLAAALAYYTLFSLAPLLIILVAIVGFFAGTPQAEQYIVDAVTEMVGEQSAQAVREMMQNAARDDNGPVATIIGIILLLFGAGGVVGQLQSSLNFIWGVQTKTQRGWWPIIRARFLSYAILVAIGFLLLVSLVITTVLSALSGYLKELLPSIGYLWPLLDLTVSFAFVTVLFALIYKVLPDVHLAWRDVWVGAALTSLLFSIGKLLIGLYLGRGTVSAVYGAAGSLVTVLLWVYYSALIFFFGAEVTQVYATEYGSGLKPTAVAGKTEKAEERSNEPATPVGRRRAG